MGWNAGGGLKCQNSTEPKKLGSVEKKFEKKNFSIKLALAIAIAIAIATAIVIALIRVNRSLLSTNLFATDARADELGYRGKSGHNQGWFCMGSVSRLNAPPEYIFHSTRITWRSLLDCTSQVGGLVLDAS